MQREDYLDGTGHPEATFVSTAVQRTGDGHLRINGELTLRGVTKPVVLDAVVKKTGVHPAKNVPALGVEASTRIKRSDFGLSPAAAQHRRRAGNQHRAGGAGRGRRVTARGWVAVRRFAGALLLCVTALVSAAPTAGGPEAGDAAPDFALPDQHG